MTQSRGVTLAAGAGVLLAWVVALFAYGDVPPTRDDLAWLTTLHDFQVGFEARKGYAHLPWGLFHALGHAGLAPRAWADGRVGIVLSAVATLCVPWFAFVAWRVCRSFVPDPRAALLAAAIGAWSPAAMAGASTLGCLVRSMAVGFAVLGVVLACEALRGGRRRGLVAAALLQATGLLVHPWAVVGPVVGLPLLCWTAWTGGIGSLGASRTRRAWMLALLLAADGLMFLLLEQAALGSKRQGAGVHDMLAALGTLPVVAAVHGAWQIPGLGRLLPMLPVGFAATLGLGGPVALALCRATRPLGLLATGGLAATLPEITSVGLADQVAVFWTDNHIKAAAAAELVWPACLAPVLGALLLRAGRTPQAVAAALLFLSIPRGVALVSAERAATSADEGLGRLLARDLLVPAAARGETPLLLGSPDRLLQPTFLTRYNEELPRRRIPRRFLRAKDQDSRTAGLDYGLWRGVGMRCELWLGLGVAELDTPEDPALRHGSPCQVMPGHLASEAGPLPPCVLDLRSDPPTPRCGRAPPHAAPGETLDPAAPRLAALAILVLVAGLSLSARPPRHSSSGTNRPRGEQPRGREEASGAGHEI